MLADDDIQERKFDTAPEEKESPLYRVILGDKDAIDAVLGPEKDSDPTRALLKDRRIVAAKILVDGKAGVDRGTQFQGPLHRAAAKGYLPMCELLLENKANVNFPMRNGGETPLYSAIHGVKANSDEGLEIIQVLLNAKADPNKVDERGNSALHCAVNHLAPAPPPPHNAQAIADRQASIQNQQKIIKALVDAGADLSATNKRGETPLRIARAKKAPPEVAQLLSTPDLEAAAIAAEEAAEQRARERLAAEAEAQQRQALELPSGTRPRERRLSLGNSFFSGTVERLAASISRPLQPLSPKSQPLSPSAQTQHPPTDFFKSSSAVGSSLSDKTWCFLDIDPKSAPSEPEPPSQSGWWCAIS